MYVFVLLRGYSLNEKSLYASIVFTSYILSTSKSLLCRSRNLLDKKFLNFLKDNCIIVRKMFRTG